MRMKKPQPGGWKRFAAIAAVLLLAAVLPACGNDPYQLQAGKVNVVTTFYPLYDFASAIGGEDAHVVNLVPAGVEPHDWTPKSRDLELASNARIFLYNGAGLEGWTDDFLEGLGSGSQLLTVEASKGVELLREGEGETAGANAKDVDPHTWVSPRSAAAMADTIRAAFVEADPVHAPAYETRYQALKAELDALDREFRDGLAPYRGRDIVVTHQSFGYLCRDYGLRQTSLMGLSPDAEPRARDMIRIIKFVEDNRIQAVFFEDLVSSRLAETIAAQTDAKTLALSPVEGLTPEQERAGEDYFTLMRRNLQNLVKALQ